MNSKTRDADASPEKRLFVSLITRDITLSAAFLDLIDNSINSAVEPYSDKLTTAQGYNDLLLDGSIKPNVSISVELSSDRVAITDDATGISADDASNHVFKFGRSSDEEHPRDRLSVYGIGLKRALFKLGNRIQISSDHEEGGFALDLNVREWERDTTQPWTFEITERAPAKRENTGTSIIVTELYDDVSKRIDDGVFVSQLENEISRTYSFFIEKLCNISLNNRQVNGINLRLSTNYTNDTFEFNSVSCAITAGIGYQDQGQFKDRTAGWFIFCNGRNVIFADKSRLTGWGMGSSGLPIFQPKHRPFLGIVFFVSRNPEHLPWTTTKSDINEDSNVWQQAKRYMITIGRNVTKFLDNRYSEQGTEVSSEDMIDKTDKGVGVISAAVAKDQKFTPPSKPKKDTTSVQFHAKKEHVQRVAEYLGRSDMGAAEVGRYTFHHFLENEIGDAE